MDLVSAGQTLTATVMNALIEIIQNITSGHNHDGSNSRLLHQFGTAGMIEMYGGASAPTGWLLCQGQAVSQTTYADLYGVIGSTFNTGGEGSGNFRLPDLQGKFPIGKSGTEALGTSGGSRTIGANNLPAHKHPVKFTTKDVTDDGTSQTSVVDSIGSGTSSGDSENNSTTATDYLQPYQAVNFIIKY